MPGVNRPPYTELDEIALELSVLVGRNIDYMIVECVCGWVCVCYVCQNVPADQKEPKQQYESRYVIDLG